MMKKVIYLILALTVAASPMKARAQDWSTWHYHADVTVLPQVDITYATVYADFTHLLKSTFHTSDTLDENSIRVVSLKDGQPGAPVSYRFVKTSGYDAATSATGKLVFEVAGTKEPTTAQYRVYFDTKANGTKPAFSNSEDVPTTANMVWNGGFEVLSKDYKGSNSYANPGENMPRGWWGNLHNDITINKATSAHNGKHALGIVTPTDKNLTYIIASPSPPGVRVKAGENYVFSFWAKAKDISGRHLVTSSIHWYDENDKQIERINITTDFSRSLNFDWAQSWTVINVPDNVAYCKLYLGTYSHTGLLTLDDINIHRAVPPLLQ